MLTLLFPAFCQQDEDVARQEAFIQLFDKEVQNRAFALLSMSAISEKVTEEEDKTFYYGWVAFEEFLQGKYKPYADKHGLSQEPRSKAKAEAFFGELASDILPKRKFYETMLDQTEDYLEKLKKLPGYATDEDLEFARFVVKQEEAQIQAIEHRIKGENQAAADVLADFINSNQ
ncbi:MAG TPA: hypothetical protein DCR93_21385 [Cytophagales bacterium]|nr:hypothetical protein [Cytophagales bacterium]HAP61941.1 hypothetical protein [Cytophagales bacterium]